MQFAAVHESPHGTELPYRHVRSADAIGGKADSARIGQIDAIDRGCVKTRCRI